MQQTFPAPLCILAITVKAHLLTPIISVKFKPTSLGEKI